MKSNGQVATVRFIWTENSQWRTFETSHEHFFTSADVASYLRPLRLYCRILHQLLWQRTISHQSVFTPCRLRVRTETSVVYKKHFLSLYRRAYFNSLSDSSPKQHGRNSDRAMVVSSQIVSFVPHRAYTVDETTAKWREVIRIAVQHANAYSDRITACAVSELDASESFGNGNRRETRHSKLLPKSVNNSPAHLTCIIGALFGFYFMIYSLADDTSAQFVTTADHDDADKVPCAFLGSFNIRYELDANASSTVLHVEDIKCEDDMKDAYVRWVGTRLLPKLAKWYFV